MRLLTLHNEDIVKLIEQYDKESKALRKDIFKLAWYMRGGMTVEEAFTLGYLDRKIINSIIEENLETAKETGMPFF